MMIRRWRTVLFLSLLLMGASVLYAPSCHAGRYEGGVESIFSYGSSARAMGMGGAFTAIADDASAVYYNPAGLSQLERSELNGLHVSLWEGVNYDCINFAVPTLDYGYFGVGVMRVGVDGIVRRDNNNVRRGEFGYHQEQFLLSYALHLSENLSFGLSGKFNSQSMDNLNATGLSSDIGIMFKVPGYNQLKVGFNIQDLFSSGIKMKSYTENAPLNFKGGLGYEIFFSGIDNRIILALDFVKAEQKDLQTAFGIEADLRSMFFIRGGYDSRETNFGGGVEFGMIGIDYAYLNNDDLGDAHRFSLSFKFGKPLSIRLRERIAREESINEERFATFSRQEKLSNANFYTQHGDSLVNQGEFAEAERAYLNALAWEPNYEPAKKRLREINPELEKLRYAERMGLRQNMQVEFAFEQAREYARKEEFTLAIGELDKILEIDEDNEQALSLKEEYSLRYDNIVKETRLTAFSYYKQKDYPAAYREYQKLLEYEPENRIARARLNEVANKIQAAMHLKAGLKLYNSGNFSLSAAEFQTALKLDPDDEFCQEYLTLSQTRLTGATTLEELKQNPDIWQLYIDGITLYQNGDYSAAISKWERVLEKYPTNTNTLRNIEQARRLSQLNGGQ
ncbi:MAG: PorV/PorQ family protein [candidate division Zixibacteria bacterium]|nr:PorV/PorQ family protein [candidate division Zixibacteria bacterium]